MNGTQFFFIRHGETEVNFAADKIGGVSYWAELTSEGKKQAQALGSRLKGEIFDHVYSSDVIRTQQTTRYCFEAIGNLHQQIVRDGDLVELKQGDWEGKPKKDIYNRPDVRKGLDEDNWNFIPGDLTKGESQNLVAERMVSWIQRKIEEHPNQRVLVFTHGLAIKYLLTVLFDRERSTAFKIPIDNTSITIINFTNGRYECPMENDTSHLKKH